ncbi:MAG: hypothetical protein RR559_00060 [Bacteroides sp.]
MMRDSGSAIVSWDFSKGRDIGILIVGTQNMGKIDILNAFQGEEAMAMYSKLITPPRPANTRGLRQNMMVVDEFGGFEARKEKKK